MFVAAIRMTALITAPECKVVNITFTYFYLADRNSDGICDKVGLEIRAGDDILTSGNW